MILRTIATGSTGNCHALISNSGEILLLDLGVSINEIKKGIDFKISDVCGAVVTHCHKDHSKSVTNFERMGIPVFAPYISREPMEIGKEFTIKAFDLTTADGRFTHTNSDGSECPCYGFLITHPEMGRMLYITDCEVIKWRFKEIDHILLGVNYDKDMVDRSNPSKNNHVFRGHLEIGTACDFVKANYSDRLQNVIMCHLSEGGADSDSFIGRMKKSAPAANVNVAKPNKEWILMRGDEPPF